MTDRLDAKDILRFRMISDPQLSPDGRRVAFVLTEQDATANRQATSVWLASADGSEQPRRLTAGPRDTRPRWSPDGARLAFLGAREREWQRDLHVLHMAGGEPERVARLPRGITEFAWSPDGRRLCLVGGPDFPAEPDRDPAGGPDEARQRYVERVRHIQRFRYRLDGAGTLDDEPRQVWVCEAGGAGLRMVTDGPSDVQRARWIADGQIAFLGNQEPDHDRSDVAEVYAVAATGGPVVRLTRHEVVVVGFAQAPDGRLATLRTDVPVAFGGHHARPWIADRCLTRELDRTSVAPVLTDSSPGREPPDPVWLGEHLYFEVADRGAVHLYRAGADTAPERVLGGDRVVIGVSAGGGRLAFTSSSPGDPLSLRIANADGSDERVLFDPNPWMRERALGELRPLCFRHDDREIDGWVLLPPDALEGERLPTLLYIHGGPHAAYGWSFPFVFQVLAGAGYAVVFCNPPGSQSYTEEFATCLRGAWGELDFPCFMALADRVVEAGIADPDRMGVGGASYGGYSTLWAITHTDRFRAALSMRPVSSLEGFYGSSDFGWQFARTSLGVEPWEEPELYRRLSPLTYLERVTTPLRLIAGTGDLRTPAEQAENVHARLRKMGREVDLVLFHGEPHGVVLAGRPWNRVRHMEAVLEWWRRYL